jgi:hypothetical protein
MSKKGSSVSLMDTEEVADYLHERVNSGEWWTFVTDGHSGLQALGKIEEAAYSGKASADFEIVFVGGTPINVGLGRKSRLTPEALGELLTATCLAQRQPLGDAVDLSQQDIIFLCTQPEPAAAFFLNLVRRREE